MLIRSDCKKDNRDTVIILYDEIMLIVPKTIRIIDNILKNLITLAYR